MGVVRVEQLSDAFVIHFESERERINAYTLASTLVAIADAAKAANATVNPGYDVEVVVEAVGPGSFRAKVRAVYKKARNLFSDQRVQAIVLGIVANFIYDRTLSVDDQVKIEVNTTEVVVIRGNDRVVVPRNVYDATRIAEKSPTFVNAISRAFESVAEDEQLTGLALVPELTSPAPDVVMSKEELLRAVALATADDPESRVIFEQCDLVILKAILERGRRKWEFVWRGVKINAPILNERFYADFVAHKITIAPGDVLQVRLGIKQSRDPKTGIYTNLSYEVVEVFSHVPALRQMPLEGGAASS